MSEAGGRPAATRAELGALEDLASARGRREQGRCLVEGPVLLAEALAAGCVPDLVLVETDLDAEALAVVDAAEARGAQVAVLTGKQARRLSEREHAPGLLAAVPLPAPFDLDLDRDGAGPDPAAPVLVVLLCGLQDPGNVGTLVRSARAFGATALLHLPGGADPLGPKALRASAGAAFCLPLAATTREQALDWAARHALQPACAVAPRAAGAPLIDSAPARCLLLLGHETRGLPALPDAVLLSVPQHPDVESLNVSMAGSVLMADWYRAHAR